MSDTVVSPKKPKHKPMPLYKVLLHNDDKNSFEYIIKSIVELTALNEQAAKARTEEAHKQGLTLLLITHKERAELYKDQFESKNITVTIEPEDV